MNISSEERKALLDLKSDKNLRILPGDEGKATVILDTSDYKKKLNTLLSDSVKKKIRPLHTRING